MSASFWCRDDDAVSDTPQLRHLLDIWHRAGIVAALAVVPERADESLINVISTVDCCVWQHGWGHHFHASGEFGNGRPLASMTHDAFAGQRALDRVFGPSGWQRVFVPPNHMLSLAFKALIPSLGYLGLSAGVPLTHPLGHVFELNAEVDLMDWPKGKILAESAVCEMIVDQLKSRRTGPTPMDRPIGLLTHHLVFDDDAWALVSSLFALLRSHRAVEMLRADRLFHTGDELAHASRPLPVVAESTAEPATAEITVVLTSCGRPDLLSRTLDSFLEYNTYPIRDFIVMEDGEVASTLSTEERYRSRHIRWLCTGKRLGQMHSIDVAYRLVDTEYIFHCEDDWEFFAPGFIEKSLAVLEHNPPILQVWIRALDDTNGHPIIDHEFYAGQVAYRLMQPGYHSEEWGTWHGFSFNPGLRRRRDSELIGSFAPSDPLDQRKCYEVERDVSEFYMKRGFLAAILADREGRGYVRHIGWGRRVGDPLHESSA